MYSKFLTSDQNCCVVLVLIVLFSQGKKVGAAGKVWNMYLMPTSQRQVKDQRWYYSTFGAVNVKTTADFHRFGGLMPLFLFFISFSFIHTLHAHILTSIYNRRGSSPFPHRWTAQWQTPPWGAESGFELGPALQQADMLPTEPCRTLTSGFYCISLGDFHTYKIAP
jgi:hypothetical protein